MEQDATTRTEAGWALDGLPDFSTEGEGDGFYQAQRSGVGDAPGMGWATG
jgi:hypothetical protein